MSKDGFNINIGGGFPGLLTLVFVIAKITGHLSWSWWWVFCPIWMGAALFFTIIAAALVAAFAAGTR